MSGSESGRKPRGGRLTPVRRKVLDRLLDQALEQPPEKRAEFAQRCKQRAPRLGFWLERLLMASAEPTGFLDQSARHMASEALEARTDPFPKTLVQGTRMGHRNAWSGTRRKWPSVPGRTTPRNDRFRSGVLFLPAGKPLTD